MSGGGVALLRMPGGVAGMGGSVLLAPRGPAGGGLTVLLMRSLGTMPGPGGRMPGTPGEGDGDGDSEVFGDGDSEGDGEGDGDLLSGGLGATGGHGGLARLGGGALTGLGDTPGGCGGGLGGAAAGRLEVGAYVSAEVHAVHGPRCVGRLCHCLGVVHRYLAWRSMCAMHQDTCNYHTERALHPMMIARAAACTHVGWQLVQLHCAVTGSSLLRHTYIPAALLTHSTEPGCSPPHDAPGLRL